MVRKKTNLSIELISRYCVFAILNIYAIRKLFGGQFYMKGELPLDVANMTLGEVDSFSLGWTFMGYSIYYVAIIGIMQLIGAWLLLWNRTKLIGAFILVPIMANIIIFDLIFIKIYSAAVLSIIIFGLLILIFHFNNQKLFDAIKILTSNNLQTSSKNVLINIGASVIALAVIFLFCYSIELLTWQT